MNTYARFFNCQTWTSVLSIHQFVEEENVLIPQKVIAVWKNVRKDMIEMLVEFVTVSRGC